MGGLPNRCSLLKAPPTKARASTSTAKPRGTFGTRFPAPGRLGSAPASEHGGSRGVNAEDEDFMASMFGKVRDRQCQVVDRR